MLTGNSILKSTSAWSGCQHWTGRVCIGKHTMKSIMRIVGLTIVLAVWVDPTSVCRADPPAPHPDDIYWADGFFLPGGAWPGGYVWAITEYQGMTVIGGYFEMAGSVITDNVAGWDGDNWESFGEGVDGFVFALTVYDGKLVAGGSFLMADSAPVNYIAAWDGTNWSPLGTGMNAPVHVLCVYNGQLIAGGDFTTAGGVSANYIAAWDGNTWASLGTGANGSVNDMIVYGGQLVVCGSFTQAGGTPAGRVAMWDGATWSPLGQGMNSTVQYLAVHSDSLFAAGQFTIADGEPAQHIAVWDGSQWSEFGGGFDKSIYALAVHSGRVVIGIPNAFSTPDASSVFMWDDTAWIELGSYLRGTCSSLESIDGELFAGGRFVSPKSTFEWNVAVFADSIWQHPVGKGFNSVVWDFVDNEDKLVACGEFTEAGGIGGDYIAAWDGNNWLPLDTGQTTAAWIADVEVFNNQVIAGGWFSQIGGTPANSIAAWDGISWSALGSGITTHFVFSLAVYYDKLIVGGTFDDIGGLVVNNVAAWNGSVWSPLGSGANHSVLALTAYDGRLIAGGEFDSAGGILANNIAAWNGLTWAPLGSGLSSYGPYSAVFALTVYNGRLIVAGSFDLAGNTAAQNIAAWDGSNWSPLGGGTNPDKIVQALEVYQGKLFAGGTFDTIGGVAAQYIALWDGAAWSPLGSGIYGAIRFYPWGWDGRVAALAKYQDGLMVGGDFMFAGGKLSTGLARWTKHYPYGLTANDPDSLYALQALALEPIVGTIYLGYYSEDYGVADIDQSSVMVNNQIVPLGIELLSSHPTLEGGVLAIAIDMRELIQSYVPLWGRAYRQYTISGQFNDGSDLAVDGTILIIGHATGDVNNDGSINVADLTFLVEYLFASGPAPNPLESGDINCSNSVNIADITSLVDYLFLGGPTPGTCP
jgi:hypothetical protein